LGDITPIVESPKNHVNELLVSGSFSHISSIKRGNGPSPEVSGAEKIMQRWWDFPANDL
jgi:hypothetical protein